MNYTKYADKAKAKIDKYGGVCTITRKSEETYNLQTNEYEAETTTVIVGKGISSNYASTDIDGTLIQQNDIKMMCYLNEAPAVDDVLVFGTKSYVIKNIKPLNLDGTTDIYYTLQLR